MAENPLQQLARAVSAGELPAALAAKARQILADDQQPLRAGLLGWQQRDKSALLQFLAGARLWPLDQPVPSVQLGYGAAPRAVCTLADGRTVTLDTVDMAAIVAQGTVFAQIDMPLPSLAQMTVLDVVSADDPTSMAQACNWAAQRCDVLIWCGTDYDAAVQAVWSDLPDKAKDNAIFLRIGAGAQGAIPAAAADEFSVILTLDIAAALRAQHDAPAQLGATGALALIAALRAARDYRRATAQAMAAGVLQQISAAAPQVAATPAPAVMQPAPHQALCGQALAYLTAQIGDLPPADAGQITAKVAQHLGHISAMLDHPTAPRTPVLAALCASVYDAADMAQLLVLERRDHVADDALCLLMQVTQDIQAAQHLP